MNSNDADRRTVLKATGATLAGVTLAGCGSSDGGGDGGDGGDGGNSGGDAVTIEPGTQIVFSAQTSHWEGKAPSGIEGAQNPTLALTEGETYTIGWDEGDGAAHNMELRDESDSVVQDYETSLTDDPGDGDFIEFEATSDIAVYRCNPHASMEGDITLE